MGKGSDDNEAGIRCPNCGCRHFFVVYTRDRRVLGRGVRTRRKECRHCGRRVTTNEFLGAKV